MKVNVYSGKGTKLQSKADLPKEIFGIKPNKTALRQYIHVYQTSQRLGTVAVKTRAEVSGGGRKPWRQKGTGRARHGSTRSPIWVGGGVAHGPKPREFAVSIPKKVRDLALKSALSLKFGSDKVYVLDKFSPKEPKTSLAASLIKKLGLRKPLIVAAKSDETLVKSFRNIPGVKVQTSQVLNPYDVVEAEEIVFLQEGLGAIKDRLGVKSPAKKKPAVKKPTPVKKKPAATVGKKKTAAKRSKK